VYDGSGGYDHEDSRHHTGAIPVDCHRPTGRALVHGIGDGQAMSRPIELTSSGSNAIEGAYALYDSLRSLEDAYNKPRGNAHPVNFNLGRISGGDWASSVPSKCEFEVRVGFLPGMSINDVKQDIETTMRSRARELGLGLDIAYRGFHADGTVLLPEYVDGMAHVNDESVDSGSR
jgi:acetylornithine deacetylase/succinyl-diaminopimelate desuccinylase-like protein